MPPPITINIYGDSIMRGTVIGEDLRYHATIAASIKTFEERFNARVQSRARFGITVTKGAELLKQDIEAGCGCDYALLEFGGNDCNFRWDEVSSEPELEHQPLTPLDVFESTLEQMARDLQAAGITPILMTLPPIDADRYLRFISRKDGSPDRILRFLGDVHMIYRFHELYSGAAARLAHRCGLLLADVRRAFLSRVRYHHLIGPDGVHLSRAGYTKLYAELTAFAQAGLSRRLVVT